MILALAPSAPYPIQMGLLGYRPRSRGRGLGASGSGAAISIGTAAGSGFLVGGPVGAAVGAITATISALVNKVGPKQDVATTNIVNNIAPYMQENLNAWNASSKSCSEYAQCIQNFQLLWNQVVNGCLTPGMGSPGHGCVNDRIPAGVTFSYNTFDIQGDGQYDWFSAYLNPILNDPAASGICCIQAPTQGIPGAPCYDPNCNAPASVPTCIPQTGAAAGGAAASSSAGSIDLTSLLIPALLLAVGLWVIS